MFKLDFIRRRSLVHSCQVQYRKCMSSSEAHMFNVFKPKKMYVVETTKGKMNTRKRFKVKDLVGL